LTLLTLKFRNFKNQDEILKIQYGGSRHLK